MTGVADRARLSVPSPILAPRLVGAVLVSDVGGRRVSIRLTEVEAYGGEDDPASHAYRSRTRRNDTMFGSPGRLYCYFTYGMHWCANVVCGSSGSAAAVLLRAADVIEGLETARARRPAAGRDRELARGPARLATCLGLDATHDGVDLCSPDSPVRLLSVASRRQRGVVAGPRVGISRAVERPWRFWLDGAPSVSIFRPGGHSRRSPGRQTGARE